MGWPKTSSCGRCLPQKSSRAGQWPGLCRRKPRDTTRARWTMNSHSLPVSISFHQFPSPSSAAKENWCGATLTICCTVLPATLP